MSISIGVLASGRGSNLEAILKNIATNRVSKADVKIIISNRAGARALKIAQEHHVTTEVVEVTSDVKESRWEYDQRLLKVLEENGVESGKGLVLLAGFDRILSPEFCEEYKGRIMNIHPALLPSFKGLEGQKQALEYGVKVSGATVHFVDSGLDSGPIILQETVPVLDNDTVESLSARILEKEHAIYSEAIKLFSEGKLELEGRRVRILN